MQMATTKGTPGAAGLVGVTTSSAAVPPLVQSTPAPPPKPHAQSLEVSAGPLGALTFSWLSPLLRTGYRRPLQTEDLWALPPYEESAALRKEYAAAAVSASGSPSLTLTRALVRLTWVPLVLSALLSAVHVASQVALPLLLRACVQAVQGAASSPDPDAGAYWAIALASSVVVGSVANQHALHLCFRIAQRVRAVLVAVLFRSALASPPPTAGAGAPLPDRQSHYVSQGQVATLLATDANRVFDVLPLLHALWSAPLLIVASTYFLVTFLGLSAFAGIAVLILLIPAQSEISARIARVRRTHSAATDARVRLLVEVLGGARGIKLNGWERALSARLLSLRAKEVECISWENSLFAFQSTLIIIAPVAAMVATFAAFTLSGRDHAAADSFAALAFFNVIRFPLTNLSMVVASVAQMRVSLERMRAFLGPGLGADLAAAELDADGARGGRGVDDQPQADDAAAAGATADAAAFSNVLVKLDGASFGWPNDAEKARPATAKGGGAPEGGASSTERFTFLLNSLSASILRTASPKASAAVSGGGGGGRSSSCTVLVGPVAGGKSSLLAALLGEMPRVVPASQGAAAAGAAKVEDPRRVVGNQGPAEGHPFAPTGVVRGARMSYAAQTPWILAGSLRENVVFGSPFEEEWYTQVLDAAGLWADCASLPAGDLTVVGERGVTLSGGQKARVALARAAYARPDLLLADDPLSALDASTGARVWDRLLGPSGLLSRAGVSRLVVTHAAFTLPQADEVWVLHGGALVFSGPFRDLCALYAGDGGVAPRTAGSPPLGGMAGPGSGGSGGAGGGVGGVLSADGFLRALAATHTGSAAHSHASPLIGGMAAPAARRAPAASVGDVAAVEEVDDEADEVDDGPATEGMAPRPAASRLSTRGDTLTVAEDRATGSVSSAVYISWFRAGGGIPWVLLLLFGFVYERITYVGTDFWLAAWTAAVETTRAAVVADAAVLGVNASSYGGLAAAAAASSAGGVVSPTAAGLAALHPLPLVDAESRAKVWLAAYAAFAALNAVGAAWRMFTYARIATVASEALFVRTLWGIFRAPLIFFETTPLGRIVNRLTGDVDTLDSVLLLKISSSTASFFWIASAVFVMVSIVPWMTLLFVPLLVLFSSLQVFFRMSVRELQRLESLSRSPLQAHFGESLAGAQTVRSFGPACAARFVAKADELLDANGRALLAYHSAGRWLGFRLDVLGASVILTVALLVWAAGKAGGGGGEGGLAGGYAGLALLWATNLVVSFSFNVVYVTETEARMVAVERLLAYGEAVPGPGREGPLDKGILAALDDDDSCDSGGKGAVAKFDAVVDSGGEGPTSGSLSIRVPASATSSAASGGGAQTGNGAGAAPLVSRAGGRARVATAEIAEEMDGGGTGGALLPSPLLGGDLVFRNVYLRYRPGLPWALRGASFSVRAGEYVGVVGRTGSGKSTLAAALFRLVEGPGLRSGSVSVGGVDVRSVGLADLRGRPGGVAIVPQDALLFTGSVRFNLDPSGLCARASSREKGGDGGEGGDAAMWEVLRAVRLEPAIRALGEAAKGAGTVAVSGLDAPLREDALSAGQRQMLCLARALLLRPAILMLDECTASVDSATDAAMHKAVRAAATSTGCTILSIAHRLSSIASADRVLVLDAGRVAEFGRPHDLLQRRPLARGADGAAAAGAAATSGGQDGVDEQPGTFSALVEATGSATAAKLRAMAAHAAGTKA